MKTTTRVTEDPQAGLGRGRNPRAETPLVRRLAAWCIAHRGRVLLTWLAVAIVTTVIAGAVGRDYATNFSLPGTESQRALDLLRRDFPAQSGDVDTIVFRVKSGTVDSPQVRTAISGLLARVRRDPHVIGVVGPYGSGGAVEVSRDRSTAFATINYDKPSNLVPTAAGKPVLNQVNVVHMPGLTVAAGGQVIENAEGFSIGPATEIGVLAALVILLLTFGSLVAAGMPLITAGFGLITAVALIGLATRITSMSNVGPRAGVDDRPRRGDRLRAVHRHALPRELLAVRRCRALRGRGDGHLGPRDPARRQHRGHRAPGHVRHRCQFHVRAGDRLGAVRAADTGRVAHGAAGDAVEVRSPDCRRRRHAPPAVPPPPPGACCAEDRPGPAPVWVAAVERDGSSAALAAGHPLARTDGGAALAGVRAAPGPERRRQ